jgi:hypothetical protein
MKQRFQAFNSNTRLQAVWAQNNQMVPHLVAKELSVVLVMIGISIGPSVFDDKLMV